MTVTVHTRLYCGTVWATIKVLTTSVTRVTVVTVPAKVSSYSGHVLSLLPCGLGTRLDIEFRDSGGQLDPDCITTIRFLTPYDHVQESRLSTLLTHVQESQLSTLLTHVQESQLPTLLTQVQESQLPTLLTHVQESQLPTLLTHVQESQLPTLLTHVQESQLSTLLTHVQESQLSTLFTCKNHDCRLCSLVKLVHSTCTHCL